ncbi:hypothetical protein [Arcobacter ellisii]|uniref:Uncharacterized protein n=1 Tax=Arcobacter ellisii TaxID=913109 RepID=A0A347UB22_9BACT|nr:hypothetical protein [Arcobacter ellisii]AXX96050.1 hypothetical protein AELL_2433 [Arcobacter ellisii]RXI28916.1 hypothetical protein CP962_12600 [Arcobacter ellisii]
MVMRQKSKTDMATQLAISDEIKTLNENIEIVASLLKDINIPFLAGKNGQELLAMFIQIRNLFKDKNEKVEKKMIILEKLPLLYLQISFIKQQIKSGASA